MEPRGAESRGAESRGFDARGANYTAAETSSYAVRAVETAQANRGRAMPLPIAELGEYFAPVMPGQLTAILAQSSHYKSGFMHFWERSLAEQLNRDGRSDEIIIHVSVEECVEEQAYVLLAREAGENAGKMARGVVQDWSRLRGAALKIGQIPIYRIGHSLARAEDMPHLYLTNIMRAVAYMRDELLGRRLHIAAIFVDYLQALPIDPEVGQAGMVDQRRLQVRTDIYRLRQMAAKFDCPVVVGVQAKQKLDGAPSPTFQIPGQYDGEESSAIAQRCDRILSLWMPKMTHPVGSVVSHNDLSFRVEENLLWVRVAKQRGGLEAGRLFKCRINFERNHIALDAGDVSDRYAPRAYADD